MRLEPVDDASVILAAGPAQSLAHRNRLSKRPFSLRPAGHSHVARLLCLALIFAGLVCLFFNEVIFQGRTFGAGANVAWVMGVGAPAWGFTGEKRINGYQVDP